MEKTSDGYGGYLYTIVFETDTGTHIVTYTDGSGAAVNSDSKTPGENTISTLTEALRCSLQKNTAYERAEAVAKHHREGHEQRGHETLRRGMRGRHHRPLQVVRRPLPFCHRSYMAESREPRL